MVEERKQKYNPVNSERIRIKLFVLQYV